MSPDAGIPHRAERRRRTGTGALAATTYRAALKIAASIRNYQQSRRIFVDDRRTFKAGCTITNIRKGVGKRQKVVYADLVDRDGVLIISATLSYIAGQLSSARICETDEPQMEYEQ